MSPHTTGCGCEDCYHSYAAGAEAQANAETPPPDTFEHVCECGRSIECEMYEALEEFVFFEQSIRHKEFDKGSPTVARLFQQARAAIAKYKEKE